jgi:hypothetical protein
MIAGEGLIGIALAVLAIFGLDKFLNVSDDLNLLPEVSQILSLVVFALVIFSLVKVTLLKKEKNGGNV